MEALRSFTALVALRAKKGEFDALDKVTTVHHWNHVQPLIDLGDRPAPATQLSRLEPIARQLARCGRYLMIDMSDVRETTSFGHGGPLGQLVDRLSGSPDLFGAHRPVPIIPVVRDLTSDDVAVTTARLAEETGMGLALRIRAAVVDPAFLVRLVELMKIDSSQLDVIIDQQYVDQVQVEQVERVHAAIDVVSGLGPVRSVVVLSGSVPRTLSRTSLWQQTRHEEVLWQKVAEQDRQHVRFGDYGAVHPVPSDGWPSKHINIKYVCNNEWLFCRERVVDEKITEEDAESDRARTFRRACRHLVDDERFAGSAFSWGDDQLVSAANGGGSGLGDASKHVAYATSHHLAYLATRHTTA